MTDWLSSTWEASWRSLQYFNLYRLILAGLFFVALLFPFGWIGQLNFSATSILYVLAAAYMAAILGGLLLSIHWQKHFNFQLSGQVAVDVFFVCLAMFDAGGVGSGLGVLLLVSLAAASLVGRGRLVLFYAALATLAVLLLQIYGVFFRAYEPNSIMQAGLVSAAFFATAILARLLGQRVMVNEDLARRRGEALDNQIRISQRVVERMQDGVLIVSQAGRVARYNPVAQAMLGLPDEAEVDLATYAPTLAAALQLWERDGGQEAIQFCGADTCDLSARFEHTTSSDGAVLVFLEDVGRVKEQAQQLKLASLGRLTASIAHEIRNPLSAISHAGELLREERRGAMQDRLLQILGDNVVRLDRIVQDILDLGRQSRAQPELLSLDDFCAAFIENFAVAEELSPEVIEVVRFPMATICFDRSHLHRVLWNLLSNALRHSTRGPASVRLELSQPTSGGRAELHVFDDGSGVPEAVREQIFEPFFTTHHQGNGLGLFIARELCAANGATLELLPGPGGAHFMIVGRNDTCQ